MIADIESFLRWFDSVHRRTLRDVAALPPSAEDWKPSHAASGAPSGENAWRIADIVRHIAGSRIYFARAYRGEGWIADWPPPVTEAQESWAPALQAAADELGRRLDGTPPEWLRRRIPLIDTEAEISGWRVLMMMAEHEVHHRSQIDTYAGLQGWPVPDIYGRSAEQVGLQRPQQRRLHPDG